MSKKTKVKPYKFPISKINPPDAETRYGTLAVPEAFSNLALQKRKFIERMITFGMKLEPGQIEST